MKNGRLGCRFWSGASEIRPLAAGDTPCDYCATTAYGPTPRLPTPCHAPLPRSGARWLTKLTARRPGCRRRAADEPTQPIHERSRSPADAALCSRDGLGGAAGRGGGLIVGENDGRF